MKLPSRINDIMLVFDLMIIVTIGVLMLYDQVTGIFLFYYAVGTAISKHNAMKGWRRSLNGWGKTLMAFDKYVEDTESKKKKGKKK